MLSAGVQQEQRIVWATPTAIYPDECQFQIQSRSRAGGTSNWPEWASISGRTYARPNALCREIQERLTWNAEACDQVSCSHGRLQLQSRWRIPTAAVS